MVDRVAAVVVLGVLAVVAVACFTIAPVELAVAPPADAAGADDPLGLLPSAVLLYLCFAGSPGEVRRQRLAVLGVVLVVSVAVAVAVLWQLGGERLALSTAPLRDALAAADASGVDGLLAVGVTVACVFALRGVLGRHPRPRAGSAGPAWSRSRRVPPRSVRCCSTRSTRSSERPYSSWVKRESGFWARGGIGHSRTSDSCTADSLNGPRRVTVLT